MSKLTQPQKQWLAWGLIAVILTGLSVGLGVQFPVPPPPPFEATEQIVTLGTTLIWTFSRPDPAPEFDSKPPAEAKRPSVQPMVGYGTVGLTGEF